MKVQLSVAKSNTFFPDFKVELCRSQFTIVIQSQCISDNTTAVCVILMQLISIFPSSSITLSLLSLSPYSLSPPWRSAHQHWFIIYSCAWETSSYWFNAYSNPALYPLLVRDAAAEELGLAKVAREGLGLMEETFLEQFWIRKAEEFGNDTLN